MTAKRKETILFSNCSPRIRFLSPATLSRQTCCLTTSFIFWRAPAWLAWQCWSGWLTAGPGYLGYGASLLWTGPKAVPLYDIKVTPGDVAVRRNADQLITAHLIGLKPEKVRLFARYKSPGKSGLGASRNAGERSLELPIPLCRAS